jgi:molybdate transport system substrate-binding protein
MLTRLIPPSARLPLWEQLRRGNGHDSGAVLARQCELAAGGPNGRVSVLVSSGEAEIGLQQVSELLSNPEVEVIGMLPPELQLTTLYSAGVTTRARQAEAAKALIRALTVASAAPVYKVVGLDPAF